MAFSKMTPGQDTGFGRLVFEGDAALRGGLQADDLVVRRAELVLLISLLVEDPDPAQAVHLTRVARHLKLCADIPELAAPILGVDPGRLDPEILRAAARLLAPRPPRDH